MNIINNYKLSQQYITLLNKYASLSFNLEKYQTLDDILTKLGVDVIIEPGIVTRSIPEALDDAENYWREQANYLESLIPNADDKESALEDYQEARKNRDEVRNEKNKWLNMPLRGLYDPIKNVIKLYPDEMKTEYSGSCMNELLVSTLAHETMHAYFNRPGHESFPYVIFVEEPLAELGMLLYLHDTGSSYYNWAYQDVSSKKTCYRYGAQLMTQHLNAGVSNSPVSQYLEAYKINLNNYPMPEVDPVGGTILLPKKSARSNSAVKVGGKYSFKGKDFLKYLKNVSITGGSFNTKKGYLGHLFQKIQDLMDIKKILEDIDNIFSVNDKNDIIKRLNNLYDFVYYLSYTNHNGLSGSLKKDLRKYASSGLKPYISWLNSQTPSIKNSKKSWKKTWDDCLKRSFVSIKIDGNDSLFAYSFAGNVKAKSNIAIMESILIRHAVESSYFFDYTSCHVIDRHNEILNVFCGINTSGGLYVNGIPYRESNRKRTKRYNRTNLTNRNKYPVLPDTNGNFYVRDLIKNKTGYDLNPNNPDFINFTISHIWGNAPSPLYFTNLWNIVLVPTWINFLLDKKNQGSNYLAEKMIDTFKAVCVEQYKMQSLKWNNFPNAQMPQIKSFPKKICGQYQINVIKAKIKNAPKGIITTNNIKI